MNYLIWISGTRKINEFVEESLKLGISRKLPFLPRQLNKGSKIYLASLQIEHERNMQGKLRHKTNPVIFGEMTVDHIEFIVDEVNPILDQKFKDRGLSFCWITKQQARKEPKRKEGKRLTANTMYVVNYPPDLKDMKIKERKGSFVLYNPFIQVQGLVFCRGIKKFDLFEYLEWVKIQNFGVKNENVGSKS